MEEGWKSFGAAILARLGRTGVPPVLAVDQAIFQSLAPFALLLNVQSAFEF